MSVQPQHRSEELLLGIDLGGTKIEAAALLLLPEKRAEVIARRRIDTEREDGYDAVLTRVASLLQDIAREASANIASVPIGVGMPGSVTRDGLVKNSNTTCLNGRRFRDDLRRLLSRDVAFENDANCFALAEVRMPEGAAAAYAGGVVFGVILGTGVGGGLVVRGEVWGGAQGIAGEWGHHAVWPNEGPVCYCGQRGCLELFASGPAIEESYFKSSGARLKLADIARRRGEDAHAAAAIEGLLAAFGRGLANVIDILDPSAVVLGGGVSNLDLLYTEGRERVARHVFSDELVTPILKNALGDSSGVLGAALLPTRAPSGA